MVVLAEGYNLREDYQARKRAAVIKLQNVAKKVAKTVPFGLEVDSPANLLALAWTQMVYSDWEAWVKRSSKGRLDLSIAEGLMRRDGHDLTDLVFCNPNLYIETVDGKPYTSVNHNIFKVFPLLDVYLNKVLEMREAFEKVNLGSEKQQPSEPIME